MLSKLAKILLSVLLCVGTSFSASAAQIFSVASASNATSSNAFVADRLDIEPYSSVHSVPNTVDYSKVTFFIEYYDEALGDGKLYYSGYSLNSKGQFSTGEFDLGRYDITNFIFKLAPGAIPQAGKYNFRFDFASDFSSTAWSTNASLISFLHFKNASTTDPRVNFTATKISGDYGFLVSLNIGAYNATLDDSLQIVIPFGSVEDEGFWTPMRWAGAAFFNFTRLSSDAQTDYNPGDFGSTENDYDSQMAQSSQQIADNTAQIVQGQNQVIEEIQALVQHISDQLFALWEQIYSGIWQPHERLMNQILQAIRDVDVEVSASLSSVVSAIDKQTTDLTTNINKNVQEIQSNIDKNTDSLKNDYNNSSMTSDNEKLNNSLSEYEKAEEELFTDAKENINNFEYDSSIFIRYVRVFEEISNFLQQIYVTLGALNIPIGFSLTLSVALLFIGYYRFKGGT